MHELVRRHFDHVCMGTAQPARRVCLSTSCSEQGIASRRKLRSLGGSRTKVAEIAARMNDHQSQWPGERPLLGLQSTKAESIAHDSEEGRDDGRPKKKS